MKICSPSFAKFTKTLADVSQEKRLQMLCILSKVESLCVCEIIERLGISQNLVSHHLKVLKDNGLVITKRKGKNIHYMINTKKFNAFKDAIKHVFTM